MKYTFAGADISADGQYRYTLRRRWSDLSEEGSPSLVWVMCNPSTADAEKDDQTIRRVVNFSKVWGYDGATIVNLFAYRSTVPSVLFDLPLEAAIGPENERWITSVLGHVDQIGVAAWGEVGAAVTRRFGVTAMSLIPPQAAVAVGYSLGLTKDGHPRHPSRARKDAEAKLWPPG